MNREAVDEAAIAAIKRGDPAAARTLLEGALASGPESAARWTNLAIACRRLKDDDAAGRAVDSALKLESGHYPALVIKGDILAAAGDMRGALAFYRVALGRAEAVSSPPPGFAAETARLRETVRTLSAEIGRRLAAGIESAGGAAGPRLAQAVDMLLGRKRRFEQEPLAFFYPELPTIQFYPRETFPWLARVEAATAEIAAELAPLLREPELWSPYLEAAPNRPVDRTTPLLDSTDWSACYLWRNGAEVPRIAARCPRTLAALSGAPLERVRDRAPFVLFSKLAPQTWIRPHTGYLNTRLVCHLPLIVPPRCSIRVGNETREWERGKALVFNDSIDHEARNDSDETRVVLIFNIWRPELGDDERRQVAALLESLDPTGV